MRKEACPLCDSKEVNQIQGVNSPVYFICGNCKLSFIHSDYLINAEKEKARYDTHQNSLENEGYVKMFTDFIDEAVLPFAKPGGTALDYGSGPTPVLQTLLNQRGYITDIYDPFYATNRIFDGKSYDLITCTEVLEHIYNPKEVWSIFAEHLKPGGVLALMTLFSPPPEQFPTWWYRRDETHVRFYNEATFHWISRHYTFRIIWNNHKNKVVMRNM